MCRFTALTAHDLKSRHGTVEDPIAQLCSSQSTSSAGGRGNLQPQHPHLQREPPSWPESLFKVDDLGYFKSRPTTTGPSIQWTLLARRAGASVDFAAAGLQ
jgi:hypothetical protein